MSEFLLIFRGGDARAAQESPEAMQNHMQKWMNWMNELGQQGKMLGANPLTLEGRQLDGRSKIVIDGPFAEGKEIVGGYLLLNAKDMDEATELSKGCPIFEFDGNVEIRPVQPMQM